MFKGEDKVLIVDILDEISAAIKKNCVNNQRYNDMKKVGGMMEKLPNWVSLMFNSEEE